MNILEIEDLKKRYGGLIAVNGVSMHLKEGEIVGLIGPNGAGKTTLLNTIAGLDPPSSGKILFCGKNTTGFTPERMCHRGLSRTFQIPKPFPKMTVLENVMTAAIFGNKNGGLKDPLKYCRKILSYVEIQISENVISENLNTIELKRLDLARSLATSPKLLFLDELAAGLTEGELSDIIKIILKIRDRGITILMVEHIMQLIMNLCDRLICIEFGKKIADGLTQDVARDPKVIEAYLGSSEV